MPPPIGAECRRVTPCPCPGVSSATKCIRDPCSRLCPQSLLGACTHAGCSSCGPFMASPWSLGLSALPPFPAVPYSAFSWRPVHPGSRSSRTEGPGFQPPPCQPVFSRAAPSPGAPPRPVPVRLPLESALTDTPLIVDSSEASPALFQIIEAVQNTVQHPNSKLVPVNSTQRTAKEFQFTLLTSSLFCPGGSPHILKPPRPLASKFTPS